jgi:hypothetical protein
LSSKQQPYDRARGSAVGADDFVDKPFDTQQLLEKVTTIARRAASAPVMAVAAPAPVVMPSATAGGRPQGEATRPRVQTLAYGSTPSPNLPASPAPPQVAPRPVQPVVPTRPAMASAPVVEQAPRPVAPVVPVAAQAEPAALPADFAGKLGGLGLSAAQVEAVLALSREVVEQVVWEVVPTLAETIIKEELKRLLQA